MDKATEENHVKVDLGNEIERIGKGLKVYLSNHFKQYEAGLPFKVAISRHSAKAKSIGLSIDELAMELEEQGFIKVFSTPTGKRFVFSGDCPMTNAEVYEWIQDQESIRATEKELSKLK